MIGQNAPRLSMPHAGSDRFRVTVGQPRQPGAPVAELFDDLLTSGDHKPSGSHRLNLTETGNRSLLLFVSIKNPLQTGEPQDIHNCQCR